MRKLANELIAGSVARRGDRRDLAGWGPSKVTVYLYGSTVRSSSGAVWADEVQVHVA